MEETTQKKKPFFHFRFGFRKEMLTSLVMIVVIIGLMIVLMPAIGTNNALVTSMSIIAVLMTLKNDYTVEPIKNTILFFVVQVGLGALAFVATLHSAAMVAVTFGVVFVVLYLFTSEEKQSVYLPFLLNFVMMLYYPVAGIDLLIRLCILGGSALVIMLLQWLLNKNKFRRTIAKDMAQTIGLLNQQINAIAVGEDQEAIRQRSETISQSLERITTAMDVRLAQVRKWQEDRYYLKIVMILKRINRILTEAYVDGDDRLDETTYQALKELLEAISLYENGQTDREALRAALSGFYRQIGGGYTSYELKEEVDTFLKGEGKKKELPVEKPGIWDRIQGYVNLYNVIFAAKTAVLAAVGVLLVEVFQLPSGYMLPLTVVIATQPYVELNTKAGMERLLNTFYAVAMFFISFSITDQLWVHVLILAAFIVIGDMFLQFNFSVVYGSLMSLVMGVISARDTVANLSVYRLGYVAAACLALMLLDHLIFPRRLGDSMKKHIQASASLNDKLVQEFSNPQSTYLSIRQLVMEIRTVNQKIRTTNQYVKSEKVNQYLMHERECSIRILLLLHDLNAQKISTKQIQQVLPLTQDRGGRIEVLHALPEEEQKLLLLSMTEILREIRQAPGYVSEFLEPVQGAAR